MKRLLLALLLSATPAFAQSTAPLDLNAVDPSLLEGFFGTWQVQNFDGMKTCNVKLLRDDTIGGMTIEVAEGCSATFPVMGEVASWRLYEGFEIAFADATRKELIRFYVPDNSYAATPEVDGIVTIIQPTDEISPAP